ncbi:MAG: excinuclease ABC subunit UvrA [Candidatus Marinimicrobia bacterium]|nr:excinuclease ABC subunit UvrA [Candidatus Neomarinimicrobiota bacterium]
MKAYHAEQIHVRGAREHNLKNIDVVIPRNQLVVITGLSGSGKSSLAFDTIYAEGHRRYVESLSSYARQFLGLLEKPDVDYIEGLSPAISIEQKSTSRNPRSTVGTITEIYDYLRLLYARIGEPHCYKCGRPVTRQTIQQMVDHILAFAKGTRIQLLAPVVRGRKGEYKDVLRQIRKEGFVRVRVDGRIRDLSERIILHKNKKHNIEVVVDRLIVKPEIKERLTESMELAAKMGAGLLMVNEVSPSGHSKKGADHIFSEHLSCAECEISYEEPEPRMFSFNSPFGACPVCDGLGTRMEIDPDLVVPDKRKSLIQGAVVPIGEQPRGGWYSSIIKSLAQHLGFRFTTPWNRLSSEVRHTILYGTDPDAKITMTYSSKKWKGEYTGGFEGVIPNLRRRYTQTQSAGIRAWIEQFMSIHACDECKGARLKKESLAITVGDQNIWELVVMSIRTLQLFFQELELSATKQEIAAQVLKEIGDRLGFLVNVGLDYLTLSRTSATLSGGEAQRIRLATQVGSQLVGLLYILDEPSIGLHMRDNRRLIATLNRLRDLGNTVLVVEHDRETIESADWVIDLGPGAGVEGGWVVASGTPDDIKANPNSLTGNYLAGTKTIPMPEHRRPRPDKFLRLEGAQGNNLKQITINLPLGRFVCVTGVSGSGKSTLINETLYPVLSREFYSSKKKPLKYESITGLLYLDKVIDIDQSPIGRTPRSNPATYTGLFTHIRDLFSQLPESKIRGYKPGRFSFNVKGGRCEACQGDGLIKIEMHFLPDVYVQCEQCRGKRYNRETLEVTYKGRTIAQVLDMSCQAALEFFKKIPAIERKLQTLCEVGLGYIKLGQQATTLSGGEAQRVKLSAELSKASTGRTIYILDEPTTGLHFADVELLLKVLHQLVDKGNTVVIIEHSMDVIKTADWIIDLGPEGGDEGGYVVAEGTPEEVAAVAASYTGQILKESLFSPNGKRPSPVDGRPKVVATEGEAAANRPTPIST